jgi:DNA repair protein SbcD/Mre11
MYKGTTMRCKFLHVSDVHLGYQQYNLKERFNDFGRAFEHIVGRAIAERVDFVLLAGDLFNRRSVDALTLLQAVVSLGRLKEARIPVLAVEGNHEMAHYRDIMSWMGFLTDQGYLVTLNPRFDDGQAVLEPWNGAHGAYLDLAIGHGGGSGMVRVYGAGYFGAATKHVVATLTETLAQADHGQVDYVILMLHAGLDEVLPAYSATVPHSLLVPLHDYVNYLALGHIHKPYTRDEWIFNPGSPETCSVAEAEWPERGYYLVEVDTASDPAHRAQLIPNPRRPFVRVWVSVDQCSSPDHLYALVESELQAAARRPAAPRPRDESAGLPPVVEVVLEGVLPFSGSELDLNRLQTTAQGVFNALVARVTNRTVPTEFKIRSDEALPRAELERQVFADLIERDTRYRPVAAQWAELAVEIKRMVIEELSPDGIIEHLRRQTTVIQPSA